MNPLRPLFPPALALAIAIVTLAPPALAQGGMNLYWDDCSLNGIINKTFTCNTNTGAPLTLVASVVPNADIPQFVGFEMRISSLVNSTTLPSWWQTMAGQCRQGAITASSDPLDLPANNCAPIWADTAPVSLVDIQQQVIGQSSFQIKAVAAIQNPIAVTADGSELNVSVIRIARTLSTGPGSCPGCLNGACFVLDRITLVQPNGVGDYTFLNAATNIWTMYNGGGSLPSQCYVPAQNRTWGQIKSLYR